MAIEKYQPHHAGKTPEARVASRLKPSTCDTADHTSVHGSGPTRTVTSIHSRGQGGAPRRVNLEGGPSKENGR